MIITRGHISMVRGNRVFTRGKIDKKWYPLIGTLTSLVRAPYPLALYRVVLRRVVKM